MRLLQSMSLRFLARLQLTKGTFLKTLVHLSEAWRIDCESCRILGMLIISDDKRDSLKSFWCGFVGKGFFSRN